MTNELNANSARTRVPQITAFFWTVKILTTAAGESTSDFLAHISPALVAAVGVVGLAIGLAIQFRMRRYVAWAYWFAVLMVAIFGTMAADVLHNGLKLGYMESTIGFVVILAIVFVWWYRAEGTLSIHSIINRRRETFYWITVLVTFALGTAAGDMTASTLGWGYLKSGVIFTLIFAAIGVAYALLRGLFGAKDGSESLLSIGAFWLAYVFTRPLGASFADWFGEPQQKQGLGYGEGTVTIVLLALIALFVGYLQFSKVDVLGEEPAVMGVERASAA